VNELQDAHTASVSELSASELAEIGLKALVEDAQNEKSGTKGASAKKLVDIGGINSFTPYADSTPEEFIGVICSLVGGFIAAHPEHRSNLIVQLKEELR